jgi:hypothetical protein
MRPGREGQTPGAAVGAGDPLPLSVAARHPGEDDPTVRTDPTDTGGLFVGRRPGTRPIRFRAVPVIDERRRPVDRALAGVLFLVIALVGASFWGPAPAGCVWAGSRVQGWTGSMMLGIVTSLAALVVVLFAGLKGMKLLDHVWIVVRRAAGYDQREGVIGRVFAVSAAAGILLFSLWMLLFAGPTL